MDVKVTHCMYNILVYKYLYQWAISSSKLPWQYMNEYYIEQSCVTGGVDIIPFIKSEA